MLNLPLAHAIDFRRGSERARAIGAGIHDDVNFLRMELTMRAALLIVLALALPASAQTSRIQQSEHILQPSGDTVEHDSFGTAVAMSGSTMVIGAVNADGHEIGAGV